MLLRLSVVFFILAVITGWVTFSFVGYSSIEWTGKLFFWLCVALFVVTYVIGQDASDVEG